MNIVFCETKVLNNNHYFVRIRAVICDSSTRSFIKCIKYCTGYNGCERCIIREEYDDKVIILIVIVNEELITVLKINLILIIILEFRHLKDLELKWSVLFHLIMHLVLLGLMKRLMSLWTKGVKECRISNIIIKYLTSDYV